MIAVKHYLDIACETGQVIRMDVTYAKIVVENIEMIKSFISKYENQEQLSPILEVRS